MNKSQPGFELQPQMENSWVSMRPLEQGDFDALYQVASDPLIWEQHPSRERYKREVFQNYFQGAMDSGGAFAVYSATSGELIGSTRFYDYNEVDRSILIGYTFLARKCWGGKYNSSMKYLMMRHAFQYVDRVIFHIGVNNIRSRKAMERIGGKLVGEIDTAYYGEASNANCVYEITRVEFEPGRFDL